MPLAAAAGLLALTLLAAPPAGSSPLHLDECETASTRIDLPPAPSGRGPVVCLSPLQPTTLRFDTPLLPQSVRLQEREHFADVAIGRQSLTLLAPETLPPGKEFVLEVCFADDEAPACATFVLLAHPALSPRQVEVSRRSRSLASLVREAAEAQSAVAQCREELLQCRAERDVPEGLRGVLASGLIGKGGISHRDLAETFVRHPRNALRVEEVLAYRSAGRVAVDVWLHNPGPGAWQPVGAALRISKGEVLKSLPLWPPGPIPADGARHRLLLEWLATETEAQATYTLTLWDAQGRTVTLDNISFP